MKAAVRTKYGMPGDLSVKELAIPTPQENELLIKVYAATVNRSDCHVLTGKPYFMRLFTGFSKPRKSIIGTDFAGLVESVGSGVQKFKPGQRVMGFGGGFGCGAQAQYITLTELKGSKMIIDMPADLPFESAAALLEGPYYAASVILNLKLQPGQKALVFGATGAIGSSYVQFLKYFGVYVTAVCGGENSELVRSLGADRIIDYHKEDFTKDTDRYDFVFDAIGRSSFFKCKRLLKKKGIYTSSGGAENLILILVTPIFGGKKVVFGKPKSIQVGLKFIRDLYEKGFFKPVIDRMYPIEKIAEAYTYVASGKKIGTVIIKMDED